MDGLDVLKNIRKGCSTIPFILVTLRDIEEAVKRAMDRGVTAFLSKPFKLERLIAGVFRVLKDSSVLEHSTGAGIWEI